MRSSVIHALLIAGMMTVVAGCQSASRWAWWKHGKASDATAVAESSTAPVLPSTAATPQAVGLAGLEPAASPSASNLAATGVSAGVAQASVPPLSEPSAADSASLTSSTVPIPGVPIVPGVTPTQQLAVSPAGPYDPNSYKPSALSEATATSTEGDIPTVADRYALASTNRYATSPSASIPSASGTASAANPAPPSIDSRYSALGSTPTTAPNASADDRYARGPINASAADRYSQMFGDQSATPVPNESPAADAVAVAPATAPSASSAPIAPLENPTATVQLKSPAGQYRPGGTSSYTVPPVQHVEIATRPAAPASTQVPAAAAPIPSSADAGTPALPAVPTTGGGVRAY